MWPSDSSTRSSRTPRWRRGGTSSRGCRRSRRPACSSPPPTRSSPSRGRTTTRPSRGPSTWVRPSTGGPGASRRRKPSRPRPPKRWTFSRRIRSRRRSSLRGPMIDPKLIPEDVLAVCKRLREAGHQAHLVGGGIRDLLLGRPPSDFDVATSGLPDAVMALFGSRYATPTGLQHGTVTVLAGDRENPRHVEVTTFRGEGEYLDGRRPSVVHFSATLEEDLARRDFTMNAIAYDPIAAVVTDPFGGQRDLTARLVRAVGDPAE